MGRRWSPPGIYGMIRVLGKPGGAKNANRRETNAAPRCFDESSCIQRGSDRQHSREAVRLVNDSGATDVIREIPRSTGAGWGKGSSSTGQDGNRSVFVPHEPAFEQLSCNCCQAVAKNG